TDCYKAFKERPDRYLESKQPAVEWKPTAESRAQGRKLLNQAIEALGGAAKWDAIRSYSETRKITVGPNEGIARITQKGDAYIRYVKSGRFEYGELLTPSGVSRFNGGQPRPAPPGFAKALLADLKTGLVSLLLDRDAPGFDLYSAGRTGELDRIEIDDAGVRLW